MTECAALCSRADRAFKPNQKQSDFFIVGFAISVTHVRGQLHAHKPAIKVHLLCGFVVAWTGHVGNIGRYGLDLPHEFISNPGVVLQAVMVKH